MGRDKEEMPEQKNHVLGKSCSVVNNVERAADKMQLYLTADVPVLA